VPDYGIGGSILASIDTYSVFLNGEEDGAESRLDE
jgi:hypothetical protein